MKVVTADFNNPKENNPEQMDQFDGETTIKGLISLRFHFVFLNLFLSLFCLDRISNILRNYSFVFFR